MYSHLGGAEKGMHSFICPVLRRYASYFINFETIFNSYAGHLSHRPSGHSSEPRGQKGKIQMSREASNFGQAFFNIELAN